jgi:hypothetical protein
MKPYLAAEEHLQVDPRLVESGTVGIECRRQRRQPVVEVARMDMRRQHGVGDAVGHRRRRQRQGILRRACAVVDAREEVTMQIDHPWTRRETRSREAD